MRLIRRSDGGNPDSAALARESDTFYRQMSGVAIDYFDQFNQIDTIKHALVIYSDSAPVACGCLRPFDESTAEIKLMLVLSASRNKGLGSVVLYEFEQWGSELGFARSTLETSTSPVLLGRKLA